MTLDVLDVAIRPAFRMRFCPELGLFSVGPVLPEEEQVSVMPLGIRGVVEVPIASSKGSFIEGKDDKDREAEDLRAVEAQTVWQDHGSIVLVENGCDAWILVDFFPSPVVSRRRHLNVSRVKYVNHYGGFRRIVCRWEDVRDFAS